MYLLKMLADLRNAIPGFGMRGAAAGSAPVVRDLAPTTPAPAPSQPLPNAPAPVAAASMAPGLKLNLGSGDTRIPGFLSVDIVPPADVIADLTKPWPWADSSVGEIRAFDVFEHLPDKRQTMNELWRVLRPGGIARLQIPHATDGDGGHCDPTHVSYWTTTDFEYYAVGIPELERFRHSSYYGIKANFRVVSVQQHRHERHFGGYVVEMQVVLEAVK
jgi:SAM-dependent methyltransferase